jgi:hypothetical protein
MLSQRRARCWALIERRLIQGNAQVDLDARSGDSNLLNKKPHEPLPLLEVESVDALPNTARKGFDLTSKLVIDGEFLPLGQQCLLLLLELPMAADHLLMPRLEFREHGGLHLIEVHHPSPLAVGLLQSTVQPFQLGTQQLIVGQPRASPESRLSLHQRLGPQQCLAKVFPDQRVQFRGPSGGLRAGPVRPTCLKRPPPVTNVVARPLAGVSTLVLAIGFDAAMPAHHQTPDAELRCM